MKAWFSMMKSSVRPFAFRSSPKCSRHSGSKASKTANCEGELRLSPLNLPEDDLPRLGLLALRGDSGDVGEEECLCPPKMPPSRPCLCVFAPGAAPPNGVALVALLAFFSRSSIFFLNCLASFSSTNERPAIQSSSSKVWKKVRSWL